MAKKQANVYTLDAATNSFTLSGTKRGRRDQILSVDTGKSIKIKSGGLGSLTNAKSKVPPYLVADGNSLKKVFKFAKDNTNSEWLYAEGRDKEVENKRGKVSSLLSSGKKDQVSLLPAMEFGIKNNVKKLIHSHPRDKDGDYYSIVSGEDKFQARKLRIGAGNQMSPSSFRETKYLVTKQGEKKMYRYNEEGLIKDQLGKKL